MPLRPAVIDRYGRLNAHWRIDMNRALNTVAALATAALAVGCGGSSDDGPVMQAAQSSEMGQQTALAAQGKHIFRFEAFGDEAKWTDQLRMHEVIRTAVDPL